MMAISTQWHSLLVSLSFVFSSFISLLLILSGYLVKYTDLSLTEALTHLQFNRKGFELAKGNLEGFKEPLEKYAKEAEKPPVVAAEPEES